MRSFFHRHQPTACLPCWVKAGLGTVAAFLAAAMIGNVADAIMIMAPLGASAVLVFGIPESPLSQPAHFIGGHLIAAVVALSADRLLPAGPWALAGTVGFVIFLIGLLRLSHPPAGATSLVVMTTHPSWSFVLTPVLSGALTLLAVAILVHRLPPRKSIYPLPVPVRVPEE